MEDMMDDAIAVLDKNGIDKIHVLGYSMGGYIAQRIALKYPNRVLSLTSLSSTADLKDDHPEFNWTPAPMVKLFLRSMLLKDDTSFLKYYFKAMQNTNGNDSYAMNLTSIGERGLYELHNRRGFNIKAGEHQVKAILASEPIYKQLQFQP
nr:alpha/beta hydrolase [Psychroserpens burtonensis]